MEYNIPAIANEFASILLENVGEENLREINRRNAAEKNSDICHSHDFCDANICMHDAFVSLAYNPMFDEENIVKAWVKAWNLAKKNRFEIV
jgi:hypothetical protein